MDKKELDQAVKEIYARFNSQKKPDGNLKQALRFIWDNKGCSFSILEKKVSNGKDLTREVNHFIRDGFILLSKFDNKSSPMTLSNCCLWPRPDYMNFEKYYENAMRAIGRYNKEHGGK